MSGGALSCHRSGYIESNHAFKIVRISYQSCQKVVIWKNDNFPVIIRVVLFNNNNIMIVVNLWCLWRVVLGRMWQNDN